MRSTNDELRSTCLDRTNDGGFQTIPLAVEKQSRGSEQVLVHPRCDEKTGRKQCKQWCKPHNPSPIGLNAPTRTILSPSPGWTSLHDLQPGQHRMVPVMKNPSSRHGPVVVSIGPEWHHPSRPWSSLPCHPDASSAKSVFCPHDHVLGKTLRAGSGVMSTT